MFQTNGKTVSILYKPVTQIEYRNDLLKKQSNKQPKIDKDQILDLKSLSEIEREKLLQMNYMGIDLGHSDILYMAKICKEDDKNYISKKDSSEVFKPAHINFDKYHKSNQFITVNEAEELNSIYNKRVFLFNHLSTNQYYNDTLVNDHVLNNHIFKSEWIEQ